MKFTKSSIAALQLPAGKADYIEFDDALPGFGIRLREGGSRTWIAQIRAHGRTRRMALGSAVQIELEPARAAARRPAHKQPLHLARLSRNIYHTARRPCGRSHSGR
jgi:Arm DNA-binding domain